MEGPPTKLPRWEDADTASAANAEIPAAHATPGMTTPLMTRLAPAAVSNTPRTRWDAAPSMMDVARATPRLNNSGWGQSTPTPRHHDHATPSTSGRAWNATPSAGGGIVGQTPMGTLGATFAPTPTTLQRPGETPIVLVPGGTTVVHVQSESTDPKILAIQAEMKKRNRYMLSDEIDAMLPPGFAIVAPPQDYVPIRNPESNPNAENYVDIDYEALLKGRNAGNRRYTIPDSLGEGMPAMEPDDAPVFEVLLQYPTEADVPTKAELLHWHAMRSLFKLKNGDTEQRRTGMKSLIERCRQTGAELIFKDIFTVWTADILNPQQRHYYVKLIERLLFTLGESVVGQVRGILQAMSPLLSDVENYTRQEGKEVIRSLATAVGITPILRELRSDIDSENESIRSATAKILAIVGEALGLDKILRVLKGMCHAKQSWLARHTGVRTIYEVSLLMHAAVKRHLPELIVCITPCVRDAHPKVNADTGFTLAALADAVAPFGIEYFNPLISHIREECLHSRGKSLAAYIRAIGSLIPLMDSKDATAWATDLLRIVERHFTTPEEELRRIIVKVVQQCVKSDGVSAQLVKETILQSFFTNLWVRRMAVDKKNYLPLTYTTVAMAKKLGGSVVLDHLIPDMKDTNEAFQRMVLLTVRDIIQTNGTDHLFDKTIQLLVDGAIQAIQSDEEGRTKAIVDSVTTIFKSLGPRLKPYLPQIIPLLKARLENRVKDEIRKQSALIFTNFAPVLSEFVTPAVLIDLGGFVLSKIDTEENALTLAALLKTLRVFMELVPIGQFQPSLDDIAQKMTVTLRNPDHLVQERCVQVIELIATQVAEGRKKGIDAMTRLDRLHNIAMDGLFRLLDSRRRGTRRATINAFGEIAWAIQPFSIVGKLLDNFKTDQRAARICAEVAIAAIADRCHPFVIVPFLINEYFICESLECAESVQRGVLKSLRFLFEHVASKGRHCAYALMPLLERGMTESNPQTRRMALEAAKGVLFSVAGYGYEDVAIHLLNFAHPNIVELLHGNTAHVGEDQERMLTATLELIEAARLVLTPGILLQYLMQGLFHPARKVRDIYWKTYNLLYLGCGDQWVPFYPQLAPWDSYRDIQGQPLTMNVPIANVKAARYHIPELDYVL
jgi:splicing factor 3B subunit 1